MSRHLQNRTEHTLCFDMLYEAVASYLCVSIRCYMLWMMCTRGAVLIVRFLFMCMAKHTIAWQIKQFMVTTKALVQPTLLFCCSLVYFVCCVLYLLLLIRFCNVKHTVWLGIANKFGSYSLTSLITSLYKSATYYFVAYF